MYACIHTYIPMYIHTRPGDWWEGRPARGLGRRQRSRDLHDPTNCHWGTKMDRDRLVERLRGAFPGNENEGLNPLDILHKFGQPLTALLYSELFWPEFREVEGMVFLADSVEDEDDAARAKETLKRLGDRQQVEKSFNFVEVPLVFGRAAGETTEDENKRVA